MEISTNIFSNQMTLPSKPSRAVLIRFTDAILFYAIPGLGSIPENACGYKIKPVMRMLLKKRGFKKLQPDGRYFERAIYRASLSDWIFSRQEKM